MEQTESVCFDDELLIERPLWIKGESVGGYLVRIAHENVLFGIRGLARCLGLSPDNTLMLDRPLLAKSLWGSEAKKRPDFDLLLSAPSGRILAGRARTRVCPMCLASDKVKHVRAIWDSPMSAHCARHKVMLVDKCQKCGSDLDYLTLQGSDRCSCGASLADQMPVAIPQHLSTIRWVFGNAPAQSNAERWSSEEAASQSLSRLAWHLDLNMEAGADRRRPAEPFLTNRVVELVQPLFEDWPVGFLSAFARFGWMPQELDTQGAKRYLNAERFPDLAEALKSIRRTPVGASSADGVTRIEPVELAVFIPRAFVPIPFPRRNRKEAKVFDGKRTRKEVSKLSADEAYEPPSSSLSVLVLTWLCTNAAVRGLKEIPVDLETMGHFLRGLGVAFDSGGKNAPPELARSQLERLLSSGFEQKEGLLVAGPLRTHSRHVIGVAKGELAVSRMQSSVLLSDWFVQESTENVIALNKEHLRVFWNSRLALDVYLWLRVQAARGVSCGTSTWKDLAGSLSSATYSRERKAKDLLSPIVGEVARACAGVQVTQSREGISYAFTEFFTRSAALRPKDVIDHSDVK